MDRVLDDLDAAEMRSVIGPQEFVVVAGHVNDCRALARLAQHFLDEVVMRLRPVPARLQRPAIDDIADEIDRLGIVILEEIQQLAGLRAARTQMDVGDEQSPETAIWIAFIHRVAAHGSAATMPS